jgi:dienelactone hydrolase
VRRLPPVLAGIFSIVLFATPLAGETQQALEQFHFDPPRLCLRDTFRWGFLYRGLPGGLAAVRDVEMSALWEGPGERPVRSLLTPTRDDLQRYGADQGRFESRLQHWGAPRKPPAGGIEIRYTLRLVLSDGQEVTSATSVRYVDSCAPPALHTTLAAGPTGRIGVRTTTPTASEFLHGIRPAATSLIWADLELPPGRSERSPAVVLVHGSGGVGPREDRWAEELRQAGAATFQLDSFTGRGIAFTAEDQSQLTSLAMIGDAYRALELLATHPRIDPARISVMGFSKGGAVALYAALKRFQRLHGPTGASFAQHIAFYAPCYITYVSDEAVTDRPIRLFHGTADEFAPIERCRAYVARLHRAGADAQIIEYAGAPHGFDRPGAGPARRYPREQNASRCLWEERPEGQLVNRDTGQPFSLDDPCVFQGGTAGPDPAAYGKALPAVKALALLAKRLEDRRGMLRRIRHARPVLAHDAVGADPHRRADHALGLLAVHHLLPVGAPGLHHLAVGIGEQLKREPILAGELRVRGRAVGGDAEDRHILALKLLPRVAKPAGFLGASRGVVARVEIDDHVAAFEIRERHRAARRVGQDEVGRLAALLDLHSCLSIVSAPLTSNLPGCSTLRDFTVPLSTSIE